ncbi:PAS domain-containing protein [Azoarcus communis]|uniref:sigma-54 interaction domain-containing protein n=1 Tax=Parazoarcus communis TaxID=41977 RepID=UPI001459AE9C|nr:sigma 54-interacting transcriptional regulator [Parazoarcus communis]NMG49486.1 PAS domain-containing protein [Parazoarcus communis]
MTLTVRPGFDYTDIRRRAMQSLFENLDTLCEGTIVVDGDARIVWINDRYARRFGLDSPDQAIGREVEAIIPNSQMRAVVESGQPILLDILDAGSETFIVTRLPLKDDDGKVIGAVGFALYDQSRPLQPFYARLGKLQQELQHARQRLAEARQAKYTFSNFVGTSPAAMELKRAARRAAATDAPVLLLGETGTGKELIAHAIHASSHRAARPFIGINVSAVPESLLETEFFGAVAGAYTGADRKGRLGKFQLAEGGTLFLDEIGDMPLAVQSKLLRVLQEQELEPVGSDKVVPIDVRVIAATSIDLVRAVDEGRFRADLYYRLGVLPLTLPPLRDRLQDLELLCEHILEDIARRNDQPQRDLASDVLPLLAQQSWRGNIRELRNVLEQAVMSSDRPRLQASDFRGLRHTARAPASPSKNEVSSLEEAMNRHEAQLIRTALERSGGNATLAAKVLGIGRATLYRKLQTHNIHLNSETQSQY